MTSKSPRKSPRLFLALYQLAAPFVGLVLAARFILAGRWRLLLLPFEEACQRLGFIKRTASRPILWVHAASLGEVNAVSGLLELIRKSLNVSIVATSTTRAGRAKALTLKSVETAVFAPLDIGFCVRRFISSLMPSALILVETELWPNMILNASKAGVPIILVNGRLSEKSFRRYRRIKFILRDFLSRIDKVVVQTAADAERFVALGASQKAVFVAGNMKYDLSLPEDRDGAALNKLKDLGWAREGVFLAASTHPGEEEILLEAFKKTKENHVPISGLVIAPRHWERVASLAALLHRQGLRFFLYSRKDNPPPQIDVLILDEPGVLSLFYPYARATFVGGTLVRVGGHNLMEPALAGSPVIFGPHTFHTQETSELLEKSGGGLRVSNTRELEAAIKSIFDDSSASKAMGPKALKAAFGLQGATSRTIEHILPLLRQYGT